MAKWKHGAYGEAWSKIRKSNSKAGRECRDDTYSPEVTWFAFRCLDEKPALKVVRWTRAPVLGAEVIKFGSALSIADDRVITKAP